MASESENNALYSVSQYKQYLKERDNTAYTQFSHLSFDHQQEFINDLNNGQILTGNHTSVERIDSQDTLAMSSRGLSSTHTYSRTSTYSLTLFKIVVVVYKANLVFTAREALLKL